MRRREESDHNDPEPGFLSGNGSTIKTLIPFWRSSSLDHPSTLLSSLAVPALAETVGFSIENQQVSVVSEAVKQGSSHRRIPEDLTPARELQVAGDKNEKTSVASPFPGRPICCIFGGRIGSYRAADFNHIAWPI